MSVAGDKYKAERGGLGEIVKIVIQALLIAVIVRTFLFQPFNIPSGSMKATLLVGDYIFVSKFSYGFSRYSLPFSPDLFTGRIFATPPKRGDVAVFRLPRDPSFDYIKRVIGLPGDRISIHDGKVFVNDVALTEPYIAAPPAYRYPQGTENGVYVVPEAHVFVLGDNRNNSQDSHGANFGAVSLDSIIGQAFFIYLPLDDAGIIPHHRYSELGE